MKTYRFEATYYISDGGEIDVYADDDIQNVIENAIYAVSNSGGYSLPWDDVDMHFELVSDDEEDDEDE